ncbi:MAG: bifunctional phosphoglucose/phosphomannose isomerase [Thermoplasmatota archaeon]
MLDDPQKIKEIDKEGMLTILENFPEQIEEIIEQLDIDILPFQPEVIVVAGMGGSGIVGDILKSFLAHRISVPIYVNKDYSIPSFVDKNTLFFAISYSGNTEETLNATRKAIERGAKVIAISSGGEMEKICEENEKLLIKAPRGYPPRGAIAFMFIPVLKLLSEMLIYDSDVDLIDTISEIKKLRDRIKLDVETEKNEAKKLAKRLYRKIPVIYGHSIYNAVANRWHTQFNENSEILSWYGALPEMNHNEIVGWKGDKNADIFAPVLLRCKEEDDRINKRIELTKKMVFEDVSDDIIEVMAEGDTPLAKILYLIYLGDYVSIYLALLYDRDPSPVDIIDELKKRL